MASANQSLIGRNRVIALGTAAHTAAPVAATAPDIILSPVAPTDVPTSGFLFALEAPSAGSATALAGGFTITPWVWMMVGGGFWASGSSASIAFGEAWVMGDVNAVGLFFQIGNVNVAGNVYVHLVEQ